MVEAKAGGYVGVAVPLEKGGKGGKGYVGVALEKGGKVVIINGGKGGEAADLDDFFPNLVPLENGGKGGRCTAVKSAGAPPPNTDGHDIPEGGSTEDEEYFPPFKERKTKSKSNRRSRKSW